MTSSPPAAELQAVDARPGQTRIQLKPSSFLVALLVDPLYFMFDTATEKLVRLEGRVPPKVRAGDSWRDLDARVEYRFVADGTGRARARQETPMDAVANALQLLSAASLGVYAGSMLTEGSVLVPYWRSASPAEFLSWYGANGKRLAGFFGLVTWIAGLVALAAALAALLAGAPGRWTALAAAALMLAAVASFFVYFERANASFASRTVSEADLPAELGRWASWHRARTVVSLAALAAALLSAVGVG